MYRSHSGQVRGSAGGSGTEVTTWVSDTSIVCQVISGLLRSRLATVTSGVRVESISQVMSYDAPNPSGVAVVNGLTTGSTSVTLAGSNYGIARYTFQVH